MDPERLLSDNYVSLETHFPRGHAWPLRLCSCSGGSLTGGVTTTVLIHVPFPMRTVESVWTSGKFSLLTGIPSLRWNLHFRHHSPQPPLYSHMPEHPLQRDKGSLMGPSSLVSLEALVSWCLIAHQPLFQYYGEINIDMFSFVSASEKMFVFPFWPSPSICITARKQHCHLVGVQSVTFRGLPPDPSPLFLLFIKR